MSNISAWSTTAASNNSASPDGWPENMAPSGVNDSARENMAAIRTWYDDAEWREWGHTVTYGSGTTFTTASGDGDTTGVYVVGRRVRAVGSSTGTIYGRITASSHSTVTTVTVAWDSGSLSNEALTISVGFLAQYQPLTTRGDLLTRDASGLTRLAVGAASQILKSDGTDWSAGYPTVLQVKFDVLTSTTSTTNTAFASDTNIAGLEVAITPTHADHRILLLAMISLGHSGTGNWYMRFRRDNTTDILIGDAASNRTQATWIGTSAGAGPAGTATMMASDLPGGTSEYTYNAHLITNTGTAYVNRSGTDTDSALFGRTASFLAAIEYAP